jgi:hypothetical protein
MYCQTQLGRLSVLVQCGAGVALLAQLTPVWKTASLGVETSSGMASGTISPLAPATTVLHLRARV